MLASKVFGENHAASLVARDKNNWRPTPANLVDEAQVACVEHGHGGLWNTPSYHTQDVVSIDMKACYPASFQGEGEASPWFRRSAIRATVWPASPSTARRRRHRLRPRPLVGVRAQLPPGHTCVVLGPPRCERLGPHGPPSLSHGNGPPHPPRGHRGARRSQAPAQRLAPGQPKPGVCGHRVATDSLYLTSPALAKLDGVEAFVAPRPCACGGDLCACCVLGLPWMPPVAPAQWRDKGEFRLPYFGLPKISN